MVDRERTANGPCNFNEPNWVRVRGFCQVVVASGMDGCTDRHVSLCDNSSRDRDVRHRVGRASRTQGILSITLTRDINSSWGLRELELETSEQEISTIKRNEFSITLSLSLSLARLRYRSTSKVYFATINPADQAAPNLNGDSG